ncbi:MAG: hypothetical protein COT74_10445 [Bdellovibrionales bacterium CG10_big_fil_rev_8_21_14_0_10_45_34]|nr:MAG: hypothetical protein COT74_10445 [Bdellovibrionales bacterium CG10_big_fil_rev_8_21_14_0_10_45_34]
MTAVKDKSNQADGDLKCPKCEAHVNTLVKIESGMRLRLQDSGYTEVIPDQVCPRCYTLLGKFISQGAKIKAEEEAKEKTKMTLWKKRTQLVRDGREQFASNAFSQAAVNYEKYLKVLEIIYEIKPGGLSPHLFQDAQKSKEVNVICSVFWDLYRIYDLSPRYKDRQIAVAKKLAEFVKASSNKEEFFRLADQYAKQARNQDILREFFKDAGHTVKMCFVANATYGGYDHPQVHTLLSFRDNVLSKSTLGRKLTRQYYIHSPPLANWLLRNPSFRPMFRTILDGLVFVLRRFFSVKP